MTTHHRIPHPVTPSEQEKSVTVSKCHSNHIIIWYMKGRLGPVKTVTVSGVTVSGEVCSRFLLRRFF